MVSLSLLRKRSSCSSCAGFAVSFVDLLLPHSPFFFFFLFLFLRLLQRDITSGSVYQTWAGPFDGNDFNSHRNPTHYVWIVQYPLHLLQHFLKLGWVVSQGFFNLSAKVGFRNSQSNQTWVGLGSVGVLCCIVSSLVKKFRLSLTI